jgi:carboxyl-terminal processing protease
VTAVLRRLDPWSNPDGALQQDTFLRLRQVRMPLGRLPGPIEDLGLILRQDGPDGVVRVVTPLRDGPAYQAGLRADDLIPMFIEESDQYRGMPTRGRTVYTREHSLDDLEEMLKGRSDTSVKLYVQRPGTVGYRVVEVARGPTQRENVLGVCRDDRDRWHFTLDPLRRIGYVRVKEFGGDAQADLAKVLDELRAQGMRGLVLDLRFNAGGQLGESLRCAGLFVGRRPITVSYDDGRSQPYKGERDPLFADLTVACLVNGQTRRYAEIVAASLEDQRRAIIVGERTAGEVEIPGFCPISGVGELRVTTGVYLRAGGGNLSRMMTAGRPEDVWGVVPGAGLECRLSPAELAELSGHLFKCEILHHPWWRPRPDTFRDRQLELALTALRERLGRR